MQGLPFYNPVYAERYIKPFAEYLIHHSLRDGTFRVSILDVPYTLIVNRILFTKKGLEEYLGLPKGLPSQHTVLLIAAEADS